MMSKPSVATPLSVAVVLVVLAGAAGQWRARVFRAERVDVKGLPWEHVREQYPPPEPTAGLAGLDPGVAKGLLDANPFSPSRQPIKPKEEAEAEPEATAPPPPTFAYRGIVRLGTRQRAIVEDLTNKKTHFLEVGQEVAGFKVLDIAEGKVILSDPHTQEELVLSVASESKP